VKKYLIHHLGSCLKRFYSRLEWSDWPPSACAFDSIEEATQALKHLQRTFDPKNGGERLDIVECTFTPGAGFTFVTLRNQNELDAINEWSQALDVGHKSIPELVASTVELVEEVARLRHKVNALRLLRATAADVVRLAHAAHAINWLGIYSMRGRQLRDELFTLSSTIMAHMEHTR
jgi:hypothetical protein